VYAVDAAACHEKPASAAPTSAGPSSTSDSASSGTGTNTADHTVRPSPPRTPEARDRTLPTPHESAPSRQRTSASSETCPPRPTATTASPTDPSSTPPTCAGVGSSRSQPAAISTVKMTWACSTSAASPGGMPACIDT
jgi:hypothetical protein